MGKSTGKRPRNTESKNRGDLSSGIWSVVSFEKLEAKGLTYQEASELMAELGSRKVPGLCIVTDKAAERLKK